MNYYLICYEMPKTENWKKYSFSEINATMNLKKIFPFLLTRMLKLILKGAERENRIFLAYSN